MYYYQKIGKRKKFFKKEVKGVLNNKKLLKQVRERVLRNKKSYKKSSDSF